MAHPAQQQPPAGGGAQEPSGGGAQAFRVTRTAEGSIEIVSVAGSVDMINAPIFTEALQRALAGQPAAVIVDLTDVTFFSSAGLGALVEGHDASAEEETVMVVVAHGPLTRRPIDVTGLDQILTLHPSLDEARSAVGG